MAHAVQPETEAVNADSFLDIVASIVSIMIIMVMMTGLKIKHTPVDATEVAGAQPVDTEVQRELSGEQEVRSDVFKVADEMESIRRETAVRKRERELLALAVNTLERRIEGAQQPPGPSVPEDRELAARLADVRSRLEDVEHQRMAVEGAPAPAIQIECFPTPISRMVEGHEIQFQLRGGRIALVPMDSLMMKAIPDARRKVHKLNDRPEFSDTVGPEDGFRLRYTLELHEATQDETQSTGRRGETVRLKRVVMIPEADDLGEPVNDAMAENSQFRQAIADRRARGATVTLWTYPDSFDAFRRVKKELYRLGFPVAARPLPEGTPISASPEGMKSSSE